MKRAIALVLSVLLCLVLFPHDALALQDDQPDPETAETVGEIVEDTAEADTASEEVEQDTVLAGDPVEGQSFAADDFTYDPEELFLLYAEKALYGDQTAGARKIKKAAGSAGSKLSGMNAAIYTQLRAEIEKVANGEQDYTVFTLPVEDLGLEKTAWTAEELGVDSILDNNAFAEDAKSAFLSRMSYDLHLIVTALMADCPYDLYWYDKTQSIRSVSYSYGLKFDEEKDQYVIYAYGSIQISFPVAEEYYRADYYVDTAAGQTVQQAVANAAVIVQQYAGESDDAKLDGYRAEICRLVSYNDDAAYGESVPYGNPWQLIWVFDGDPDTNVVCEGYSKAFQYLCDLTTFNGNIRCLSITGTLSLQDDPEGHMWNIVTLDNGNNYLVDVTNCDEGSIGAPKSLFLVPAESGSVEEGYTFPCGSMAFLYTYDEDMTALYSREELTISDSAVEEAAAEGTCGENLTWRFENGVLTISGSGRMDDYINGNVPPWNDYRERITALVVKEGVTAIGSYAFSMCDNLETVTLEDGLLEIGGFAFYECTGLTKIVIPKTVEIIKYAAFSCCSELSEITLSESLTTLNSDVFHDCRKLSSIDIPNTVSYIGEGVFWGCSGLKEIAIPESITKIPFGTFYDCDGLTHVEISEYVEYIGFNAFGDCDNLLQITVSDQNPTYRSMNGDLYNNTTLELLQVPAGKTSDSYVVPDEMMAIGSYAFSGCDRMKNVVLHAGIDNIPLCAFAGCDNLETVTYDGCQCQWSDVEIHEGNEILNRAEVITLPHVYGEPEYGAIDADQKTIQVHFSCENGSAGDYDQTFELLENRITEATCEETGETVWTASVEDTNGRQYTYEKPEVLPALGHDYQQTVTAATCTDQGYTTYTCSRCGDSYVDHETDALDHEWDTGTVVKEATSIETGILRFTCKHDASHTYEETIDRIPVELIHVVNEVSAGQTASFTVQAVGDNLNYYWQYSTNNGATWNLATSRTNLTSITTTAKAEYNGYLYRCVVSNASGSAASNAVKLAVTGSAVPVITKQPTAQTAAANGTATFSVTATGATKYTWQYSTNNGATWNLATSRTDLTSITTTAKAEYNGYLYRCVVSNASGSAASNAVKLAVTGSAVPVITKQPTAQTAAANGTATFSVAATGATKYTWQYSTNNGATWNLATSRTDLTSITTTAKAEYNGYLYRCVVSNASGSAASNAVKLTVTGSAVPVITKQPTAQTAAANGTATFSVAATGATKYTWQYSTNNGTTWNLATSRTDLTSITTTAKAAYNGYLYRCVVSNASGSTASNAVKLTVTSLAVPVITKQPTAQTAAANGTVTFSVTATGATKYTWQYSTNNGATWNLATSRTDLTSITTTAKAEYNGYLYRCVVSNASGSAASNAVKLTVTNGAAPVITKQPTAQTAAANGTATFSVTATGATKYTWQYSTNNGSTWNLATSRTDLTSITTTAKAEYNGYLYRCVVSNASGSTASNAVKLTVTSGSSTVTPTGGTVYWVDSGEVYHSTRDCPSLARSSNIHSGTIAQSGKTRPCRNCY